MSSYRNSIGIVAAGYSPGFAPQAGTGGSVAIGNGATAPGSSDIAIGTTAAGSTSGTGQNILIGLRAAIGSTGSNNIIIGKYATAITNNLSSQIKIGLDQPSNTGGTNSIAIGNSTFVYDSKGIAIGYAASVNGGTESVAIGQQSSGGATYSVAIGSTAAAAGGGSYAVAIGYAATASNFGGAGSQIALGANSQSGFQYSIAIGETTYAYGDSSVALGHYARSYSAGQFTHSAGKFSNNGDANTSIYLLRVQTTNATPTEMMPGGVSSTHIFIQNFHLMHFEGIVVARRSGTYEYAAYTVVFDLKRDNNAASTALIGSATITAIHETDATWDVSVSVDTTTGYVSINVTGAASKTINWFAQFRSTEVMTTS